ncbi:hypothetical protein C1645_769917 [Glomus cerebriforme]|uniref:Transmembrane protein n=1 Tax=Glomus cerebriforme TaxID=658196 RepID=A0A397T2W9_9GLOM|nr:hypothetical protein C1645_769917 [Glomus cerebriforme]
MAVSNFAFVLIGFHILLLFLCPALEIWKLKLFNDNRIPIDVLEYIYPILIIYQIVMHFIICCCFNWYNAERLKLTLTVAGILWLIIPVIYTRSTIKELGDVPFFCPSDYNYPFNTMKLICIVRASNLIVMWIRFVTIVFMVFFIEKLNLWTDKKRKIGNNNNNNKLKRQRKNSKSSDVGAKLVSLDYGES